MKIEIEPIHYTKVTDHMLFAIFRINTKFDRDSISATFTLTSIYTNTCSLDSQSNLYKLASFCRMIK